MQYFKAFYKIISHKKQHQNTLKHLCVKGFRVFVFCSLNRKKHIH